MVEPRDLTDQERLLLGNVLDGLDDLYDRTERADWQLWRLLAATSRALRQTRWALLLDEAAIELERVLRSGSDGDETYLKALSVTGPLRTAIAGAV